MYLLGLLASLFSDDDSRSESSSSRFAAVVFALFVVVVIVVAADVVLSVCMRSTDAADVNRSVGDMGWFGVRKS